MAKDDEYRGILDELAQQQLARQRERDTTADQRDNERGGSTPGEARLERLQRESAVCTTHHAACACGQLAELRLIDLCQRLERENAALREALRDNVMPDPDYPGQWLYGCAVPRDAVEKARELLAGKGEEGGA